LPIEIVSGCDVLANRESIRLINYTSKIIKKLLSKTRAHRLCLARDKHEESLQKLFFQVKLGPRLDNFVNKTIRIGEQPYI